MSETSLDPAAAPDRPKLVALLGRKLIAVTGEDAAHFLHNVLTANIMTLPVGSATLAALLTPQGKIIADMLVANASDEGAPLYFLDLNRGFAEDIAQRLATYKLRAKAEINVLGDEIRVNLAMDAPPLVADTFYAFPDPRALALGQRLYGPVQAVMAACPTFLTCVENVYFERRNALGIPECGRDYLPMGSYPHEANMDQLGGVDFKKGCYVGQEVVSRMEYRKMARTRTLRVRYLNGFGVDSGAEVRAGEHLLGHVGESWHDAALAQVRLDRWEEAQEKGLEITAGGVPVSLEKPGYAKF